MMTRRLLTLGAAAALTLTLGACGDDADNTGGGSGGGDLNFSESGSAQLNTLSADQRESMCQEVERYAAAQVSEQEQRRFSCVVTGVFAAAFSEAGTDEELRMACIQARDACIAMPPDDDDSPDDMDSCELNKADAQSCTATVAEIEACTRAEMAQFKEVIDDLSCETLTLDSSDDVDLDPPLPAACQTVEQKCPALFEDDDEESPPPAE